MISLAAFLFLLFNSALDLRFRKISLLSAAAAGVFGSITALFVREVSVPELAVCLLPGAGLMVLSRFCSEGIGMGDGIATAVLGLYVTLSGLLAVLVISFFLAGACGGLFLVLRRKKNMTLPFLPFLLTGYLCLLLIRA